MGSHPTLEPLRLTIRGLGPLFNFKNSKMLTGGKLITDPELKKRMQAIVQSLELQLRYASQRYAESIQMGAPAPFSTHCLPHDDCWTAIPELRITSELVTDGSEGCDITIERIG